MVVTADNIKQKGTIKSVDNIREDVTKVLEIGVETGRSHRLWLEYFPNATIYGFDIFKFGVDEFHRLQKGNPNLDRSIMFEGDQENVDDLERFLSEHGEDFDIIIDDGGHTMRQQIITFECPPPPITIISSIFICSYLEYL